MLYNLLFPLASEVSVFNLFRYITFRTGGAILTALLISFIFGPRLIAWLKVKQKTGQPIRKEGPQSHLITKQGTPTMGGLLILISMLTSTLIWADLSNIYIWITLIVTCCFGLIGFIDDYLKVKKKASISGFSGRSRLLIQFLITGLACYMLTQVAPAHLQTHVAVPFLKQFFINLGWFFIPFGMLVIVGSANAVNLTDGLDGLAIVPVMIAGACFGLIAYLVGNAVFANYLQIPHIPGTGELTVFVGAMLGAGLGFLWYNAPPASVFMGDTGSLSLGAALGTLAVLTKHELVLAVIGGLFVLEAVSVIVQVASFKMTGKRVFRMAPLHHHFEQKGWAEHTIVIRFWIISVILALIGLSTLKLR